MSRKEFQCWSGFRVALRKLVITKRHGYSVQVNTFVPKCHFLNKVERFPGDFSVEGSVLSAGLFMISLRCWFAQVLAYLISLCLYNQSIQLTRCYAVLIYLLWFCLLVKIFFLMKPTSLNRSWLSLTKQNVSLF